MLYSKVLACAFLLAASMAMSACGREGNARPEPNDTATPSPSFSLASANPDEYFRFFPFHIGWIQDVLPERFYPSTEDGPKYEAALAKLKERGIEALSDDERRLMLVSSWYARLMQTETVRYRVEELNASGEVASLSENEETYEPSSSSPLLVSHREVWSKKAETDGASPDQRLDLFDLTTDPEEITMTEWSREGNDWGCASGRATARYLLVWHVYVVMDYGFAEATPVGTEEIGGRSAYKFRVPPGSPQR